jgi:hypothetical protein
MRSLAAYLERVSSRRWQYGEHDCCTFMADWIVENGLPDPMCDRRGAYSSNGQYRKLIRQEGGLVASCGKRFAAIGLLETEKPKAGDVALVMVPFGVRNDRFLWRPTGSICVSSDMRAVIGSGSALVVAPLTTIKAWVP